MIAPYNVTSHDADYVPDEIDDRPSKSQIKREMHDLLDLGRELVELSTDRLKQLPLSDRLFEAIRAAQRVPSAREGRRRAVHFVGKLMRDAPAEEIRVQLETWKNGSLEETAAMHRIESLRERLVTNDETLTQLLERNPDADIQALRAAIRGARKEAEQNVDLQPGQLPQRKHYRALFQMLKGMQH